MASLAGKASTRLTRPAGAHGAFSTAPRPCCRWMGTQRDVRVRITMEEAFQQAYTMSQLYVQSRPEPIPLSEHEARRKRKDMQEIVDVGKSRGKSGDAVQAALEKLETILPDLINLNKMKASDWVLLADDVEAVANKLITLKTYYPRADIFAIVAQRPKTLLMPVASIQENADKVRALLQGVEDPDAIIQAVPELMDATALSRSLAMLAQQFPSQNPLSMLETNPTILFNQGESDMEDFAEYGELSTKD